MREILTTGDTRQRLIAQGATPVGSTPAQFQALIESERKRYARIIAERGITAE